jgi:hypothetical protein
MDQTNGNNRPVTLKDLIEALTEAEARIEDRIVKGVVAAMDERLESLETKLLTEFHAYGERIDLRLRRVETAEATTAGRVASLEDEGRFTALELRVIETEKRLRKLEGLIK